MKTAAHFFDREDYLLVQVVVPWTTPAAKQIIDETKKEAIARNYRRILFDLTLWAKPDDEMTRYSSGEYLALHLGPPFKIAAFTVPQVITKFGENVAVNRAANFRIFPDEAAAIQWLLE
jgi:hypothetical protein